MESQQLNQRGNWGSKVTFIFAATGSAIGLGNIWRFPMVVGENGGAAFVFVYIVAVALIGFTVMLAELIIGRHTQKNPVGAFDYIRPRSPWKGIGYLGMVTGIFILSYYGVLAGMIVGYFIKTVGGAFRSNLTSQLTEQTFNDFASNSFLILFFFFIIIAITTYIISKGVKGGIERYTKVLMPILFVLIVFLSIRALTLPGAGEGIKFYLNPDFSKVNFTVIFRALGQAFFSLSLGMGTMITYGSYINKKDNLVSSAGWVSFSDTLIAFLAGLIIFPTLFAIPGISPDSGPSLVFKVFPLIFGQLPGGQIFGMLFFLLLLVAAITSTISLLEVPVAFFVDERKWPRTKAAYLMGLAALLLGVPSALSWGGVKFLTRIEFWAKVDLIFGNISLALGALLICLFVGWVWGVKKAIEEVKSGNRKFSIRLIWIFSVKFLSPIAIIIILIKIILG
jgi:NSS family neurotransmitter:Na+ symporter